MNRKTVHLLVLLSLITWKMVSTDWVLNIPWIDYVESSEFIWSVSVPNAPIWGAPEWVYDTSDARYKEWYWSGDNPLLVTSGASHPTGEGVLQVCWGRVIFKISFCYALFVFCEKLYSKKKSV